MVLSLGVHPEQVCTPVISENLTSNHKRCEIGCKLVLITNGKLHMSFQLAPKSVNLNGVMALILIFSPNSVAFGASYIKVVEDTVCDKNAVQRN